jgi:hypothetical protein
VRLDVVKYEEFNDPRMGHRIGYAAEGHINRQEIQINIEGELVEETVPAEKTAT